MDCAMISNSTDLDISVVITAHREGRLPHRTLRSVRRSIICAEVDGVRSEIVVVLDRPDTETRAFFEQQRDVRLYEVDFGDTGPSRNFGARQARGRYINYLDADDLFSRRWLAKAIRAAVAAEYPAVWSPQFTVIFENENVIWRHVPSSDPEFRPERLIDVCHWLPANLMRREIALQIPFQACHPSTGFGSEDWHWHCELLAAGVAIEVVSDTSLFYRRRHDSRSALHIHQHAVYRPTRLFDFTGLERFGIGPSSCDADTRCLTQDAEELKTSSGRPRSSIKVSYRSYLQPRLPQRVDSTLRRMYFRTFPMGVKHWARSLPKSVPHGFFLGAKWLTKVIVPKPVWKDFRAAYHFLRDQHTLAQPGLQPTALLPAWLLEDWKDVHAIEPNIFPASEQIAHSRLSVEVQQSAVGEAFLDVCRRLGKPWPSHVFLVPWLTTGGSDRTALNYIHALYEQGWADRIVVLATEERDSPWAERLPDGVRFLPFGHRYRHLTVVERKRLLVRLLLQMAPQMIHNVNSWLGYEVFLAHGKALAQASHLLGHIFCCDTSPEGRRFGYPVDHVPRCFDVLSAVISDNQTLLDELQEIFHLDSNRLLTHYQPVALKEPRPPRIASSLEPLKILWAGRLDRQKRVDVLNAVAEACALDGFQFHAYGSRVLDSDGPMPGGPHLQYHGPFDGFESLPVHEFDVFLYTSQWDGLPNVLLEAMAAGLVVVASSAGGVKELIQQGKTGYLIEPIDDVNGFVAALRSIDTDRAGAARLVHKGYRRLLEQHSQEQFVRRLRATPGYMAVPRIVDTTAA
jgi:glycosyltransferase involved in cell wall biosynthesis